MFNFEKVDDFEKHINLSIPNYDGLCDIFRAFVSEYANPEGVVIDIGCSTGSFLHSINKRLDTKYQGVDVINISKYDDFDFIIGDCEELLKNTKNADVIISMFTLQFLGKHKRKRIIKEFKRLIKGGAVLLISEKCFFTGKVENVLKRDHLQQKRLGFSDTDILNKDKDLFGSMYCLTDVDLNAELSELGSVVQVWQSYNFKGLIVY